MDRATPIEPNSPLGTRVEQGLRVKMLVNAVPLVSVVIPAFNSERYLGRAIRSVLSQTYPRIECIVVDDGSTDRTPEVIAGFDSRVQAIRRPNGGASRARNTGIEAARGRYIAFLDSDDYWLRNKLELQVHLLVKDPELVLVSSGLSWIRSDVDPDHIDSCEPVFEPGSVERFRGLEHLIVEPYLGTPTVVVDAAATKAIGGFDTGLPIGEDVDFYFRLCARRPYAILRQDLVRCQLRRGSLTTHTHGYSWNLRVLDRLVEANPEFAERYVEAVRRRREAVYTEWIESLIFRGDSRGAREVLMLSRSDVKIPNYSRLLVKSLLAPTVRAARRMRRRKTSPAPAR